MEVFKVDLYEYFNVSKPEGGEGVLTCYIINCSPEINIDRKSPAMLVIPGGGYGMVSDREGEPVALAYLSKGFNSFVLNYSVAPIRYPYQLTEAVMAMAYIRLNAEKLGVNAEKIASVGFSAGGHLCASLGSYYDSKDVKSLFSSPVNARPNAVVLSYAVITHKNKAHIGSFENLCGKDNFELYEKLDILNLVNENSAPAFIWATYNDGVVPVRNSILVAEAYERAGVPFSVHIWGKGAHGISVANRTVYGTENGECPSLANASKSVGSWVDLSVEWLDEMGININD